MFEHLPALLLLSVCAHLCVCACTPVCVFLCVRPHVCVRRVCVLPVMSGLSPPLSPACFPPQCRIAITTAYTRITCW